MTMAEDVVTPTREQDERESEFLKRSKATGSAGSPPGQSIRRLTVGRADDPAERLADKMADSAVALLRSADRAPSSVRRDASNANDPLGGTRVDNDVQRTIDSRRGSGSALRKRESEHFSNAYGTDLSGVRVHTDSTADKLSRSLQANAFTTGSDIFFRKGTYQPGTSSGDHLIGHELAHVATEGGGGAPKRSIRRGWFGGGGGDKKPPPVEKHSPKDGTTVFQKIGESLEEYLENEGDSIEFGLEISIPVAGYSVGATLGVEAEKDGGVQAKVAMAITGGVSVPGVDLKAALGGYLEAKGADGKMAGNLLGYSLYRRLAESNAVPAEVQAYMFGGGDKKAADANMSAIEKEAFGDEDSEWYAESGASAALEADIGAAGVKVSGGATTGTRTDRKSLEMSGTEIGGNKAKGGGMLNKGIGWATGGARGAEKSIGRGTSGLEFKAEFSSPLEAELSYEAKWIEEDGNVSQLDTREFGVQVTVPEKAAEKVKPLVDTIFHFVNSKEASAKGKTKKEKAGIWVQAQVDKAKELATDQMKEAVMETETGKAVGDAVKDAAKSAGDKLGIGYKDEEKMAIGLTVDLKSFGVKVAILQTEEKKITLPGIEASMKKTSKKGVGVGSQA